MIIISGVKHSSYSMVKFTDSSLHSFPKSTATTFDPSIMLKPGMVITPPEKVWVTSTPFKVTSIVSGSTFVTFMLIVTTLSSASVTRLAGITKLYSTAEQGFSYTTLIISLADAHVSALNWIEFSPSIKVKLAVTAPASKVNSFSAPL